MEINLERHIASLEARQPNVKSAVQQFLEKCTGDELHQLEIIAEKTEIREREPRKNLSSWMDWRLNMDLFVRLSKRLAALEARKAPKEAPCDRWPPLDCDPARRLARYASYFDGRAWECMGTPERRAQRDARLAHYQDYFEALEVDDEGQS